LSLLFVWTGRNFAEDGDNFRGCAIVVVVDVGGIAGGGGGGGGGGAAVAVRAGGLLATSAKLPVDDDDKDLMLPAADNDTLVSDRDCPFNKGDDAGG
jgi:hypothetical protein